MKKAWLVRSGRSGENDAFCIQNSCSIINWSEAGDLSKYPDRESMLEHVGEMYPGGRARMISHYTGQLLAFSHKIKVGDFVCLPLKTTGQVAIGEVTGPYEFVPEGSPQQQQRLAVNWIRTDISRTAFKQDLLYTLGAFMTVCEITRNDGAWRIEKIAETGSDPGSRKAQGVAQDASQGTLPSSDEDDTQPTVDLIETAEDQVMQYIIEEFSGHALTELVGAVLETEGFQCEISPPGPDGGIDIFAGRGPLGLDSPKLVVQVKSQTTQVDARSVRELQGVGRDNGADQALLVAWGGINRVAANEMVTKRFNLRVWDAHDLIERIIKNYESLPAAIKSRLPLRQLWVLDVSDPSLDRLSL